MEMVSVLDFGIRICFGLDFVFGFGFGFGFCNWNWFWNLISNSISFSSET
jgi:hypothetical protein